ncbi:MAG: helix-turn-helix transcriptional regulator, partial [Lachnospiraceae bacterium]|nr:helix-turn-helix transcriptional regulator [Lachnospiraceae bacterium]
MEKNKVRYKELREANGKTQEEISSYLDCTPRAYRSYEQGKQDIKLEYLIKLSELYHVSLEYILGIDDNE